MDYKIGKLVKKIRTQKEIKASIAYEGIFQKTQYYNIENGYVSVNPLKLETLFQRLGIVYPEYRTILQHKDFEKLNIRYKIIELINEKNFQTLNLYLKSLSFFEDDNIMMQYYNYAKIISIENRDKDITNINKLIKTYHYTKDSMKNINEQCFSEIEAMLILRLSEIKRTHLNVNNIEENLHEKLIKRLKEIYLGNSYYRIFDSLFLILAIAINNIGDIIFDLFIAWKLTTNTNNIMNAVYIIGTSVAFRAILSFFIGSFVDKHPKKKIMIMSHISSVSIITCFALCWGLINKHVTIGLLFVLLNDINNELFSRSYISMTSDMFDENQYIRFESCANIVIRIVSVGGAALAGTLIDNISSNIVFGIDILTYLISLMLVSNISYNEVLINTQESSNILEAIVSDVKYTLSTILHSSYLLSFILLMLILNLAYDYIPLLLPVFKANSSNSATLLGFLRSSITIGEVLGLAYVTKHSRYVSATFKTSMILNIFIIITIYLTQNSYVLVIFFALYGFSDSLTQPLFSHTVTMLDSENRGKLLGGIVLAGIFLIGLLIVSINKDMKHIVVEEKSN